MHILLKYIYSQGHLKVKVKVTRNYVSL